LAARRERRRSGTDGVRGLREYGESERILARHRAYIWTERPQCRRWLAASGTISPEIILTGQDKGLVSKINIYG